MKKRILTGCLAFAMMLPCMPTYALEETETSIEVITGFESIPEEQNRYIINKSNKPDLEQMIDVLPDSLNVYLESGETEEIDVTWFCVGEDFDTSDSYYFQFSPSWDDSSYVLSESMDILKDAPYVAVLLTENEDTNMAAVTNIENEEIIYKFLKEEMGLNTAAACGVLANIYKESAFNPNVTGDYGTSYGICQWHNSRWSAMKQWCSDNDYDWKTLIGQLYYLKFELSQNSNAYLWNGKTIFDYISSVENTAQGAYDAGYYWCKRFEVPADTERTSIARGNFAKDTYWPEYADDPEYETGDKEDHTKPSVFNDVNSTQWFYSSVEWAYKKGMLAGTSETTFSPNDSMTRGMLVTVFYRMEGRPIAPTTKVFSDVQRDKYYSIAIDWATSMNIVSGYSNGKFGPEDSITREQIAKVLYRYAEYKEYDVTASVDISDFSDASNVSGYAKKYMEWAVAEGMIKGSNGKLNPKGNATRAEISAILKRFVEKYE